MAKTSIHIQPCNVGSSEHHNRREKELDYVAKERTHLNERWEEVTNLPGYQSKLSSEVKSLTGRAMQKKATPIREGVIVIQANTTMSGLRQFAERLEAKYKLKTLQLYIHRDEGHKATAEDVASGLAANPGEFICNHHAHIVFDWMDHATGKSIKINRQQMSEIQTLLAETLGMERGVRSDKKHLNSLQFKEQAATRRIDELHQQKQQAAAALAKIEAPLTEIIDATQESIIEPPKFSRWDALRLFISPKWGSEKLGRIMAVIKANYKQAIRAKQNSEEENAALKKQQKAERTERRLRALLPLMKKIPELTPALAKSIAEGQKVSMWLDDPKQGKIYVDVLWSKGKEKDGVQVEINKEWKSNKRLQENLSPKTTQTQPKSITQNRGLHR